MDLLLAICQAIGIGLAVGIGGPLAALFVAVMASVEAGIDPRGTDWDFLGKTWFLVVLLLGNVAGFYLARSGTEGARRVFQAGFAGIFGAIAGAASLAEQGESAAVGLVLGLLAGVGSALVACDILAGARRRAGRNRRASDDDAAATAATLELIFALAGIVVALLALFVPPLSLLGLVALGVLAAGRRRRAGEKYEGLRVLR
jgi:hypothetical protein